MGFSTLAPLSQAEIMEPLGACPGGQPQLLHTGLATTQLPLLPCPTPGSPSPLVMESESQNFCKMGKGSVRASLGS